MRRDYEKFTQLNTEILVVGPEDLPAFQEYWEKHQLPFVGLPDPEHKVLNLYGQEVKLLKLGRLPAMAVIDQHGLIRSVHYGSSMSDIPRNEEVLALLTESD